MGDQLTAPAYAATATTADRLEAKFTALALTWRDWILPLLVLALLFNTIYF